MMIGYDVAIFFLRVHVYAKDHAIILFDVIQLYRE